MTRDRRDNRLGIDHFGIALSLVECGMGSAIRQG